MQHVYLSYSKTDYDFAHRLVDDLQAVGYMVFVDAVSEPGSMAWAAETRRAIRGSGAVIMLLTPEKGRRTGIRHEGIGAKRRGKPVIVLRRSPGDLPRYLNDTVVVDATRDYDTVFGELLIVLPPAAVLMNAPEPANQRPLQRPPRQPEDARRRRRVLIMGVLLGLSVVAALVLGLIPV